MIPFTVILTAIWRGQLAASTVWAERSRARVKNEPANAVSLTTSVYFVLIRQHNSRR